MELIIEISGRFKIDDPPSFAKSDHGLSYSKGAGGERFARAWSTSIATATVAKDFILKILRSDRIGSIRVILDGKEVLVEDVPTKSIQQIGIMLSDVIDKLKHSSINP